RRSCSAPSMPVLLRVETTILGFTRGRTRARARSPAVAVPASSNSTSRTTPRPAPRRAASRAANVARISSPSRRRRSAGHTRSASAKSRSARPPARASCATVASRPRMRQRRRRHQPLLHRRRHERRQPLALPLRHPPPLRRQPVVATPCIVLRRVRPLGRLLDPAPLLQPLEREVQRARARRDPPAGAFLDLLQDAVAVAVFVGEGEEDVEGEVGEWLGPGTHGRSLSGKY